MIPESTDAVHLTACVCVCVCSGFTSHECLTSGRWNNGAGAVNGEECCAGLNDPVSERPRHAPILIKETGRKGKQPYKNTEGAAA